jgi:eukaryotic-like serine/threonine-protein kinase
MNDPVADVPGSARPPESLGKYPILGRLGKGGMGVVYKSFDPVIRRPVALKTIRKELISDEDEAADFTARFRHEAQAAGRLLHPGIVAVYEYGEDAQLAFIAMEYVEGSSLREYSKRNVRFEERDLVSITVQLLEALQYAHDRGVWHRDIKPANIIIMNNGRIKVADFGIARVESSTLTRAGAILGTHGYIAPEQYLGKEVDHRVDLFAAGVVFYELLTGKPPFSGPKDDLVYRVCHEPAVPPSVVSGKPSVARFDPIALRALAKHPKDRYPSADKFRSDLLAAYDQPVSLAVAEETLIRDVVRAVDGGEASSPKSGGRKSSRGATPPAPQAWAGSSAQVSAMRTEMLIAAGWNIRELASLERSLIHFLGPIGRVMVRRATRQAQDFASLVKLLADQLTVPAERAEFLRQNLRLSATGTSPPRIAEGTDNDATVIPDVNRAGSAAGQGPSAEDIVRATRLLAEYVGPISQVLVREAARPGVTRTAFLAILAQRLSESEKERFLQDFQQST